MEEETIDSLESKEVKQTPQEKASSAVSQIMPHFLPYEWLNQAETIDQFETLWNLSKEIDQYNQWYKGDIADKISVKYGEASLKDFAETVGEKYDTMIAYRRVARAFPKDKRDNSGKMSWSHYMIASQTDSFDKAEQKFVSDERYKWIERAEDESWSVARLKLQIAEEKAAVEQSMYYAYDGHLVRFGNMITHFNKATLTKDEKEALAKTAQSILDNFVRYMLS